MKNSFNKKQWLIVLLVVVFIFLAYWFFHNQIKQEQSQSVVLKTEESESKLVKKTGSNIHIEKKLEKINNQKIISSYQGSQPDGAVNLDELGQIIVDKDLKRLFDYYLTAIGELPIDQMRKYLQQFASQQLNPQQLQQLLEYFDQYQSYLSDAESFAKTVNTELSLQEKMQLLAEFRAASLGVEMAEAFFADEENYISYVMAEKQSDDRTEQQQEWLEAENQATEFQDVILENKEFAEAGVLSSEDVYQYRTEKYGQKAADRLTQLDQQRAQWQKTVEDYIQQRQQIENQQSVFTIEQLNAQYSLQEVRRLEALWRINKQ